MKTHYLLRKLLKSERLERSQRLRLHIAEEDTNRTLAERLSVWPVDPEDLHSTFMCSTYMTLPSNSAAFNLSDADDVLIFDRWAHPAEKQHFLQIFAWREAGWTPIEVGREEDYLKDLLTLYELV